MTQTQRQLTGVRLVAERGLPAHVTERVERRLERSLTDLPVEVRGVVTHDSVLEAVPREILDMVSEDERFDDDEIVVFVTEMPRMLGDDVIVAEMDRQACAAVVSLPALGPFPSRKLVSLLTKIVAMVRGVDDSGVTHRWLTHLDEADENTEYLLATGRLHRAELALGMVRDNRPWRLIPMLTGMTAAAAAAASFGIFYSSIWSMAHSLSAVRLAVISVLSVVLAGTWLIVNNRLWEREPAAGGRHRSRRRRRMYNTATLCTVLFSSLVLYAGLYAATLLAAVTVIDPQFLTDTIGAEAGLGSYATLSWLAASLGMFAGALGSSADSYEDILHATYGYREQLRRKRAPDTTDESSPLSDPDADTAFAAISEPQSVTVSARPEMLPVVRHFVEQPLQVQRWPLDDIIDVTLGVDEICTQLVSVSSPDRRLSVSLGLEEESLRGRVEVSAPTGSLLYEQAYGWEVVEAVTDSYSVDATDRPDGRHVVVGFSKGRRG